SSLRLKFYGNGFYPVEMDGYGVVKKQHWPVVPEPPFSSPALPQFYLHNGSPVAYLSGSRPRIKIEGQLSESVSGRGKLYGISENLTFEGKAIGKNGELSAKARSESRLPEQVEAWENENIRWTLKLEDGNYDLGESRNSIYVLLDKPVMALLHTPLKIAS